MTTGPHINDHTITVKPRQSTIYCICLIKLESYIILEYTIYVTRFQAQKSLP